MQSCLPRCRCHAAPATAAATAMCRSLSCMHVSMHMHALVAVHACVWLAYKASDLLQPLTWGPMRARPFQILHCLLVVASLLASLSNLCLDWLASSEKKAGGQNQQVLESTAPRTARCSVLKQPWLLTGLARSGVWSTLAFDPSHVCALTSDSCKHTFNASSTY